MKIKGKVFKVGNSYGIRIKKALVDAEIFAEGQEVELIPVTNEIKKVAGRGFVSPTSFPFYLQNQEMRVRT